MEYIVLMNVQTSYQGTHAKADGRSGGLEFAKSRNQASLLVDIILNLLGMLKQNGPKVARQILSVKELVHTFQPCINALDNGENGKLVANVGKTAKALASQLNMMAHVKDKDVLEGVADMLDMFKSSLEQLLESLPGQDTPNSASSSKRKRQHSDWGLTDKNCPSFTLPNGFVVAAIEPNPNIQEDLPRKRRRTESTNSTVSLPTSSLPKLELPKQPAKNHRVMAWRVGSTLEKCIPGQVPKDLTRLGTGYARIVSPTKSSSHRLVWVKDENPMSPVVDMCLEKRVLVRQSSLPWLPDEDNNVLIVTSYKKEEDDLLTSPRTTRPQRKVARSQTVPDLLSPKPRKKKEKWIVEETVLFRAFDVQKADDLRGIMQSAGVACEDRPFTGKPLNVIKFV
jgi:hypothetical protein